MKAAIAIDSFKGSLSSIEAGNAAAEGIRRVFPDAECVVRPLADGGEGTVDALVSGMGGELREVDVTGPGGKSTTAKYALPRKNAPFRVTSHSHASSSSPIFDGSIVNVSCVVPAWS